MIELLVSKSRFIQETITFRQYFTGRQIERPTEGDLIYNPIDFGLYEIKFADQDIQFYQAGKVYTFKLTCEKIKYSYEQIEVNNEDINLAINNQVIKTDNNNDGIIDELNLAPDGVNNQANNAADMQLEGEDVYDFSENDPFSGGNY